MSELTAEYLRTLLRYEPETGNFTWLVRRPGIHHGRPAGCKAGSRGAIVIGIDKRLYLAHRLAWLWVHGEWPRQHIDHIDGNPSNNRLANLRDVPRTINLQNRKRAASHSRSGVLGVQPRDGRWIAQLRVNGRTMNIGRFDTKEEAHEAYLREKRRLHLGCTI